MQSILWSVYHFKAVALEVFGGLGFDNDKYLLWKWYK